jgi:ectoine hydroxylase-related dioxygenase (phytanoyl-CoA dioxygenase family)
MNQEPYEVKRFSINQIPEAVAHYNNHGYVVFADAFDLSDGVRFWNDVEHQIDVNERLTYSWYGQFYSGRNAPLEGKKLPRIIDIESHSDLALGLLMTPLISSFLSAVYLGVQPTCLQTLTYKFSSEQPAHSDKTLVAPPCAFDYDRDSLTAAWIALEASNERNGALVIYPGSHLGNKRGFYDGFDNNYGNYSAWLQDWCATNGLLAVTFHAEPGDILFWHGDFVHAGGPILESGEGMPPTRKSLVCHYGRLEDGVPSRDARWTRQALPGGSYFRKLI